MSKGKKEEHMVDQNKGIFAGGVLAYKMGMTSLYNENGKSICVTLLHVANNIVTACRTREKHGYNAVQVGVGLKRKELLSKPDLGIYSKIKVEPRCSLREFRVDNVPQVAVGATLGADGFNIGESVCVTGVSKGKGFQGVFRRHNFHGGPATHGSRFHRAPGSIGMRARPGKVYKGRKMPGRMGGDQVTISHLKVIDIDREENILAVIGSVPGAYQSLVEVRKEL
ncbi:MAG: 50S ribosomal protein L3 [Deltaproteobacteria bacterium]|nr:50S ribosomal protein L3 [Deltaproteobacteria bacterium]